MSVYSEAELSSIAEDIRSSYAACSNLASKNLPPYLQEKLYERVKDKKIVPHGQSLTALQVQLLQQENHKEIARVELASNVNLVENLQLRISKSEDIDTAWSLAANPSLLRSIKIYFSTSSEMRIRCGLADNKTLEIDLQHVLAHDKDVAVKARLAGNEVIATSVQEILAKETSLEILKALAFNKGLVLTNSLPVPLLHLSERTRLYLSSEMQDFDQETVEVLAADYSGTLEDLKIVVEALT